MNVEDFADELESKAVPLDMEWVNTFNARAFSFLKLKDPNNAIPVARVLNALSGVCRGRGVHSPTLPRALRPAIDHHRAWCERRLHVITVAVLRSLATGEGCQPVLSDVSESTQEEWEDRFLVSLFDAYEANRGSSTFIAEEVAAEIGLFDRGYVTDVVTVLHDSESVKRAGIEANGRQYIQLTSQGRSRAQALLGAATISASDSHEVGASAAKPEDRPRDLREEKEEHSGEGPARPAHALHPLYSAAVSGRYGAVRLGLIARREADGWVGLMASWLLVPARDDDDATVTVDDLLLHVGYHSLDEGNEILAGLAGGSPTLLLDGEEVRFTPRGDTTPPGLHDAQVWGWHSQRATWSGVSIRQYIDATGLYRTARKLPGATPRSFSDWNAVAAWAIPQQPAADGRTVSFGPGWMSLIHFDAPTYVSLREATFDTEHYVRVHVEAHQTLEPIAVVIRDSSERGEVGRLAGTQFHPAGDDPHRYSAVQSCSRLVPPVIVHLLEDGAQVQWVRLDTPQPARTTTSEEHAMTEDYEYDVALSFAGEDRVHAGAMAEILKNHGVKVFYDVYETANLWGEDLAVHLHTVYSERARYVVMFASAAYKEKVWTNHERRAAQERALSEKGAAYILPVRIDDTRIPGLPSTTGYLSIDLGVSEICEQLMLKLAAANSSIGPATQPQQATEERNTERQEANSPTGESVPAPECPHCHSFGPWNGVICGVCGRKSTNLD